jgi:phosphohistidine phosphatase SixA
VVAKQKEKIMKFKSSVVAAILASSLAATHTAYAFQSIYIVRHAEKKDASKDPELSEQGQARAKNLAKMLHDSDIGAIFTSEYLRTQKTAAPLADDLKIKPSATNDSDKLVKLLKDDTSSKSALVVGHSNTVPDLLKAFGSDQKVEIGENEFDRLYIVTPQKNAKPIVNLIRY